MMLFFTIIVIMQHTFFRLPRFCCQNFQMFWLKMHHCHSYHLVTFFPVKSSQTQPSPAIMHAAISYCLFSSTMHLGPCWKRNCSFLNIFRRHNRSPQAPRKTQAVVFLESARLEEYAGAQGARWDHLFIIIFGRVLRVPLRGHLFPKPRVFWAQFSSSFCAFPLAVCDGIIQEAAQDK